MSIGLKADGVTGASQGAMSCQQGQETRSVVERIAAFAVAARPERLTPEIRRLFKRNILDSLACAIAALPGRPFAALRDQFEEYRAPGRCTLIGGGKTSLDQAALFNSGLTRYVDLLDSYMSPGGLAHPSDNFGTVLAAAEYVDASGEDFMLALAVAYEIQCRFTAVVPVMTKGFNHALQLAMSTAAATGRLFGLSPEQIANAISIATADNISLACIHRSRAAARCSAYLGPNGPARPGTASQVVSDQPPRPSIADHCSQRGRATGQRSTARLQSWRCSVDAADEAQRETTTETKITDEVKP